MRIEKATNLLPPVKRGKAVEIYVDGNPLIAYEGETIAAAMLAAGLRVFRHTPKTNSPRGIYCGMGVCFECLVTVDHVNAVRACMTQVYEGMHVETRAEWSL
ncbi:MAG: (2Fe-2S)-binding protein [Chloroflexi bacterium]|nr:(2Fe-2S)-binding protein [Anaerolineaceae bacterium]NMB87382.1 (2Fe-2S)-binding protein [Chloroflexota bacterium]